MNDGVAALPVQPAGGAFLPGPFWLDQSKVVFTDVNIWNLIKISIPCAALDDNCFTGYLPDGDGFV